MNTSTIKSDFKKSFVTEFATKYDSEIVAYSVLGEPLNEKLYNQKLERARADFQNGRVIASNDLKKKYSLN